MRMRLSRSRPVQCSRCWPAITSGREHRSRPGREVQGPVTHSAARVSIGLWGVNHRAFTPLLSPGRSADPSATEPEYMVTNSTTDGSATCRLINPSTAGRDRRIIPCSTNSREATLRLKIESALTAHCCGTLGCRTTEDLLRITIDSCRTRVVCLRHANSLLVRELEMVV